MLSLLKVLPAVATWSRVDPVHSSFRLRCRYVRLPPLVELLEVTVVAMVVVTVPVVVMVSVVGGPVLQTGPANAQKMAMGVDSY